MKIFLSYAAEDRAVAEQIALALEGRGDEVFFDRDSLQAGCDFHQRIQTAIEESDFLIFLISADSVQRGSYALTELKLARLKWPHPKNHVLSVLVRPVDQAGIPAYLQALTILEPEGNTAAEVLVAMSKSSRPAAQAIGDSAHPRLSVTVEWKRRPKPDPTPRRWVVYLQNAGDTAVTVKTVRVTAPGREPFVIDWGTIPPGVIEDYELKESDFEPAGDRPEAAVRFLDSYGRLWLLRGAVLELVRAPATGR